MTDELAALDATAQAEFVRRGDATPAELVDAAILRIERINPQLNAVIIPLFDKARAHAANRLPDGPFKGVPFLLKDLDAVSDGDPFHCGMKFLRDLGWVEDHESYLVQKFRAAGFVILGKTNTPELGLTITTEPAAYGPSCNPWDLSRSTGGSSGGSAAAVAAGLVPAAHASDGGGSIRIPASACGLVGLKPSRGRVSLGPEHGEYWHGLVVNHVVTRSVRDSAAILDAVAGPMPGDPYFAPPPARPFRSEVSADPGRLRVGMLAHHPEGSLNPDCAAAVIDTGRVLESLGHTVEASYPTPFNAGHEVVAHFSLVVATWVGLALDDWSRRTGQPIRPDSVEPNTWALAEMGRAVSATQYLATVDWLHGYTRRMAGWWADGFDLLVTPTLGSPPPRLGALTPTRDEPLSAMERVAALIPFTPAFNITGQPAISLPLAWSAEGLPVGVQLVAAYGREDVLIRVAAQLEQERPWAVRRPPVHA